MTRVARLRALRVQEVTDFTSFNLAQPIVKAIAASGYAIPTPIQRQAIPLVLAGRDLLGIAQTGTGKTAAFALPILNQLTATPKAPKRGGARALVLAPTRELASQIAESFSSYGRNYRLRVVTVFGGSPINKQIRAMECGADVLVATPGRLIDLIERKAVKLCAVETLVLDEADQMLDLGFIHALRRIVPLLPRERQTLFFSATMPKAIADLAAQYLRNPASVAVAPAATTAERVDQRVTFVKQAQKQALLAHTLNDAAVTRALVFTRTKHGADRVVRNLATAGHQALAIHGNKSQPQRERALLSFKTGRCRVLVATDIAARGIDIDEVSHVINFEIPNMPEQYVHRIGRTARAGATGRAISFVGDEERAYLRDIEKLTRMRIPVAPAPAHLGAAAGPERPAQEHSGQRRDGGGRTSRSIPGGERRLARNRRRSPRSAAN
jgi:ATP-dependent RNA helicase RhlE